MADTGHRRPRESRRHVPLAQRAGEADGRLLDGQGRVAQGNVKPARYGGPVERNAIAIVTDSHVFTEDDFVVLDDGPED